MEERERQRQTKLLQKGIIKKEEYDLLAKSKSTKRRSIRRRRHAKMETDLGIDLLVELEGFNDHPIGPDLKQLVGWRCMVV